MWLMLFISTILLGISSVACDNYIVPQSYRILTEEVVNHDLSHAFDNDRRTPMLLFHPSSEKVTIRIILGAEYEVNKVEIISDVPEHWRHSVAVGYAMDTKPPLQSQDYSCTPNKTATLCKPFCDNRQQGVVGTTILWSIERTGDQQWSRIYDVLISGNLFEKKLVVQDKVADVILMKPYRVEEATESDCSAHVWKLMDESAGDEQQPAVSVVDRNMTVYFGRPYGVTKVSLIVSKLESSPNLLRLHFGGRKLIDKEINLESDCSVEDSIRGLRTCSTPDLDGYPLEKVTVNIKGLVKLHVLGMPFYYPRVALLPSVISEDPASKTTLHLRCVSLSCGVELQPFAQALAHTPSPQSCALFGQIVKCRNMQLLRLPLPATNADTFSSDKVKGTVLISNGQIEPTVGQIMTGLSIVNSSNVELAASLPRTHHYYGQYQCRCLADDILASVIESPKTDLTAKDFAQGDLVFQRNYSAIHDDNMIQLVDGFFELPQSEQSTFFQLLVSGYSLSKDFKLHVTLLESGVKANLTGDYAQVNSVQAFPPTADADVGWPVPAYKVELLDVFPDSTDDNTITITWSSGEGSSKRMVKDIIRTVLMTPANVGSLRAWLWDRTEDELDIRAYYQMSKEEVEVKPKTIYLQRSSCAIEGQPERVATVNVTALHCKVADGSKWTTCSRGQHGHIIRFDVKNPLASDAYTVYVESEDGMEPAQQLVHSAAMEEDLSTEVRESDISLKAIGMNYVDGTDETKLKVAIKIHSKVILDNSVCFPMSLKLNPKWSTEQLPSQKVTKEDTIFTLVIPSDTQNLEVELILTITASPVIEETRTILFPNPRFYEIPLTVERESGVISWSLLPVPFRDMLDKFQVDLDSTIKACGNKTRLESPTVYRIPGATTIDQIRFSGTPEIKSNGDTLADYEFTITPVFKGFDVETVTLGKPVSVTVSRGMETKTILLVSEARNSTNAQVHVTHGQQASCIKSEDVSIHFDLEAVAENGLKPEYIHGVTFNQESSSAIGGQSKLFSVNGLLAGRRYNLKAFAVYATGIRDELSDPQMFWTKDDVRIASSEVFASPGDKVVINCTGVVSGPGASEKFLEWKRADDSPLPEGGRNAPFKVMENAVPTQHETGISLIFDKVENGQSGQYGCYIRPSVAKEMGVPEYPMITKLTVTELELSTRQKLAEPEEEVLVLCSTDRSKHLEWIAPDGTKVPVEEKGQENTEQPFVLRVNKNPSGMTAELHIPKARSKFGGSYMCIDMKTEASRSFQLQMKESINVGQVEKSSTNSNERLMLKCTSTLGSPGRYIVWYHRSASSDPWTFTNKVYEGYKSYKVTESNENKSTHATSHLEIINSPMTNGEFACHMKDNDRKLPKFELQELPKSNARIAVEVQPVLHIEKDAIADTEETKVRCIGFPAHSSDQLQWGYLPEGSKKESLIPIGQPTQMRELSNQDETTAQVLASFRMGGRTHATWPGFSGPQLLAAASRVAKTSMNSDVMTPELLELIITKGAMEVVRTNLNGGSLVCQYKRPKALFNMADGEPDLIISKGIGGHDVLTENEVPIKTLFDPESKTGFTLKSTIGGIENGTLSSTKGGNNSGGIQAIPFPSPMIMILHLFPLILYWLH